MQTIFAGSSYRQKHSGDSGMKGLRAIILSILMVLLLTNGVTYAQIFAEENYNKGMEYAVQGKFPKAKEEFEKALKFDRFYEPTKFYLKVINNVIKLMNSNLEAKEITMEVDVNEELRLFGDKRRISQIKNTK